MKIPRHKIDKLLKIPFPFKQRQIIKLRYGIDGGTSYSRKEVARILRMTTGRVAYLEAKALRTMKSLMESLDE